jgi:hypothetical protein
MHKKQKLHFLLFFCVLKNLIHLLRQQTIKENEENEENDEKKKYHGWMEDERKTQF